VPRRKAKPQEVASEAKPEVAEAKPIEAKPQELSPPPTKLVEVKEVKPVETPKAKEAKPTPTIKSISWEEFERFEESSGSGRRSWVKEAIEAAKSGPVMLEGLTRGQVAALINYVDKYNSESRNTPKIAYKYDAKKGVVLLAPVDIKK